MKTKAVAQVLGGHVHVDVFVAPDVDRTYACCGRLTFTVEEWAEARRLVFGPEVEVVEGRRV